MPLLYEGDYLAEIETHRIGRSVPDQTPYLAFRFRLVRRLLPDGRFSPCPAERRVIRLTPVGPGRAALDAALAILGLADGEEVPMSPTFRSQTGREVIVRCRHGVAGGRPVEHWELIAALDPAPAAPPTPTSPAVPAT